MNATAENVNVENSEIEYAFNEETKLIEISVNSLPADWAENQGVLCVFADIKVAHPESKGFQIGEQLLNLAKSKTTGEFKMRAARGHGTGPRSASAGGTAAPRKAKKSDISTVLAFLQDPATAVANVQALRKPHVDAIEAAQKELKDLDAILAILEAKGAV